MTRRHSRASVQMPGGSGPLALPELVLGLEIDASAIARAQGLLDRFLARRQKRTSAAYTLDIEEFAAGRDLLRKARPR